MRESGGEKIAHVRLSGFTSGAHGEVRKAVDELLGKGAQGVVLDLRDNGGGLLNEAVLISSIFIPDGHDRVDEGPRAGRSACSRRPATRSTPKIPVVVLVNGESASASEIVTGALQDRDRAEVVGTRTFGKGVFQEVRQLSNGGALDITVGEYFTPDGRNLGGGGVKQGAGIEPDVEAEDDAKTAKRGRGARGRGQDGRARGDVSPQQRRSAASGALGGGARGGGRPGRRGARAPRPLPRPPSRSSRAGGGSTSTGRGRACTRAWATSCSWRRAARAPGTGGCCAGSAGPTSRATCSRR